MQNIVMMEKPQLYDNKTVQILRGAAEGHYGVLAAIAYNIEHILGFVQAAESKRSPLIIQLFPWAVKFSNGILVHAAAQAAKQASVPISVHLDHCQDEELVKSACDLPFDSIMIDMSHHSKEENLAKTRELVSYCHSHGIAAEAEPGRIEGGEDGIAETADLSGLMTTSEETEQFIDSGVNILAPAFGNVHGEYGPRGIILEWDRYVRLEFVPGRHMQLHRAPVANWLSLEEIHKIVTGDGAFIALHGVNRFPTSLTRRLIAAGVTKVNVNRDILMDYYKLLENQVNKVPFTQLLEAGVNVVAESMGRHMDIVMSSGKA